MDNFRIKPRNATWINWALLLMSLLYLPLLAGYVSLYSRLHKSPPELMPILGRRAGALEYELRKYSDFAESPFAGDPRPQLETAWHHLLQHINIRVSKSDLDDVNLTSLELSDGSGYVAQPSVFHELHCIKRIRHWVYKDHYLSGLSEHEALNWKGHIDHCIEMLRSSAMCRGDTALTTFHWLHQDGMPRPSAQDLSYHECVRWEPLLEWVKENEIDLFDPTVLRRPDDT
ncbi:unnamed protein product [Zymoseptoria tritici ST99CH_3D1]|uniref:Tat pathway signal sequence n=1 Tax=Zymoseptoria tritici ST99CH_1E4 TaxID=1276532 RepID=A0A2H1FX85_ZYMTR|nr:unnamed protein product [Zymoseptoria tritici ST99CH_1E4]SMR47157.1 unnamed protein product [Zymoseptoria tritici ST99CH_3D1]